jgi:hypothetical protein
MNKIKTISYWLSCFALGVGISVFVLGIFDKDIYSIWLGFVLMISNGINMISYWNR